MFFIIFNFKPPSLSPPPVLIWHELQAAIKEKQKELSEANGFLDLALSYFNPSWILPRLLMSNCCLPGGSWFSIIANPSLKCRQVTRTLQPQPRVGSLPFFPTSHWLFHLPPHPWWEDGLAQCPPPTRSSHSSRTFSVFLPAPKPAGSQNSFYLILLSVVIVSLASPCRVNISLCTASLRSIGSSIPV